MSELAKWDSFYVIVGSAAGALIGLQFVVMTLIAARPPQRAAEASKAFASPTVVHFGAVLLLSALLRAPWSTIAAAALLSGLLGLAGVAYVLLTAWRVHALTVYKAELEDWLFHIFLPIASYAALALAALAALSRPRESLFVIGGAALVLLFSCIHNVWDAVAWQVFVAARPQQDDKIQQ